MIERRYFSRLAVTLNGYIINNKTKIPIVINNFSVPIQINDISEIGIGFQYRTNSLPEDITINIGDILTIEFKDNDELHKCTFEIIQIRERLKHTFVGGKLKDSDGSYPKYVQEKKRLRFELDVANLEDFLNRLGEDV